MRELAFSHQLHSAGEDGAVVGCGRERDLFRPYESYQLFPGDRTDTFDFGFRGGKHAVELLSEVLPG